ncbi:MAG: alpha/beta fold hydrolase [Candidatus Sericytochromatia bacterium]
MSENIEKKHKVAIIENIKIKGDYELDATVYRPEEKGSYPCVLVCHGFLSSKEEAGDFPYKLAEEGYIVLAFDFSGHGKSEGDRGYCTATRHLDDSERALKKLWEQEGVIKEKTAVLGHSMGTVATIRLLGESEEGKKCLTGIVLAPVRKFSDAVGKFELEAYKFVAGIAWPVLLITGKHMYLPYKVKTSEIFLDQEIAKEFEKKNLLQTTMPINNYYYMIKQIDNEKYAPKVQQKILAIIGKHDKVIPPLGSRSVFEKFPNKDKKLVEIENCGHSLMMDYGKNDVFKEVKDWLVKVFE